ncbi:hypothetical protein ACLOJK_007566, partial [Asimina triloba]
MAAPNPVSVETQLQQLDDSRLAHLNGEDYEIRSSQRSHCRNPSRPPMTNPAMAHQLAAIAVHNDVGYGNY